MHNLTAAQDAMLTIAAHKHTAAFYAHQSAHQFSLAAKAGWPLVLAILALIVIGVMTLASRSS